MRYDAEHKQRTRRKVLTEAAAAIRLEGPENVGVAGLMAKAGLTHGGFYAHFRSKDDLIAEAIGHMFEESHASHMRYFGEDVPPVQGLARFIDMYLSPPHRDARAKGCPIPALVSDVPRLPDEARARYFEGVARMTARIAAILRGMDHSDADDLARAAVSEMVGAVALSRAAPDRGQADRILESSRVSLKKRLRLP